MASEGSVNFPPQGQHKQPGIQHIMNPQPQTINPNYKASNKLQGKVALVTGGDSGIGRAVAYHFALEGATLAITHVQGQEDRDKDDALKLLRQAKTSDAKDPIAIATDVKFDKNCKRVVDQVVNEYGRIDVLVNNAAEEYLNDTIENIGDDALEHVFRTNIFSHFFMTRHALKHMKEGSSIINTTSVTAYAGNSDLVDYASTKGAIVSFTRSLALQLVGKGIRVNGVAPGPVWTPLNAAALTDEMIANYGSDVPVGRPAQPYEIAPSYVFLASNEFSSYFTGQVLHPNGGLIVNA